MTKEERREYNKAWREKNPEKVAALKKAWREANPEKVSEYNKTYQKNNKDKVLEAQREWNKKNKAKRAATVKKYHESQKLNYYVVYALPNFNGTDEVYCGITKAPNTRMRDHKVKGRNPEDWFVLDVFATRAEARIKENEYHDKGFIGRKGK